MLDQHELTFPLLTDAGCAIAEQFGIAYTITPEHRRYFQSILVNIPYNHAGLSYTTATEESWRLPLPATFIVNRSNTITFTGAHADFRVRPEPAEVLAALDAVQLTPRSEGRKA